MLLPQLFLCQIKVWHCVYYCVVNYLLVWWCMREWSVVSCLAGRQCGQPCDGDSGCGACTTNAGRGEAETAQKSTTKLSWACTPGVWRRCTVTLWAGNGGFHLYIHWSDHEWVSSCLTQGCCGSLKISRFSRPGKSLKTHMVLESPWICVLRSLNVLEFDFLKRLDQTSWFSESV